MVMAGVAGMRCHGEIKQKLIKRLCAEVWAECGDINKTWYGNPEAVTVGSCDHPKSAGEGPLEAGATGGGCIAGAVASERVTTKRQSQGRERAEGLVGIRGWEPRPIFLPAMPPIDPTN